MFFNEKESCDLTNQNTGQTINFCGYKEETETDIKCELLIFWF